MQRGHAVDSTRNDAQWLTWTLIKFSQFGMLRDPRLRASRPQTKCQDLRLTARKTTLRGDLGAKHTCSLSLRKHKRCALGAFLSSDLRKQHSFTKTPSLSGNWWPHSNLKSLGVCITETIQSYFNYFQCSEPNFMNDSFHSCTFCFVFLTLALLIKWLCLIQSWRNSWKTLHRLLLCNPDSPPPAVNGVQTWNTRCKHAVAAAALNTALRFFAHTRSHHPRSLHSWTLLIPIRK